MVLMTTRSHDQYNTTIYAMDDRYRGVFGQRRVSSSTGRPGHAGLCGGRLGRPDQRVG
jgi:hypothetical protein